MMLNEYYCEYWTKDNRKVGKRISAQSGLDAKLEVEKEANFKTLCKYPEKIK